MLAEPDENEHHVGEIEKHDAFVYSTVAAELSSALLVVQSAPQMLVSTSNVIASYL